MRISFNSEKQESAGQKPSRFRFHKPLLAISFGLALCGASAYFGYMKGRDTNAVSVAQKPFAKTAMSKPTESRTCPGVDFDQFVSEVCTQQVTTEIAERVRKNLEGEVDYWKERVGGKNPRLLHALEAFLAKKGLALEKRTMAQMEKKIAAMRVGDNIFISPFNNIFTSGYESDSKMFLNLWDLEWVPSPELKGKQKITRMVVAHEAVHYLADLGRLEIDYECLSKDEAAMDGLAALTEGFTDYLTSGVAGRVGIQYAAAYRDEVCVFEKLSEEKETLNALVKVFFMPDEERPLRKKELDRAILRIKSKLRKMAKNECNLNKADLIKGTALLDAAN